jgi:single-stranded-DNA-specific exonuclease
LNPLRVWILSLQNDHSLFSSIRNLKGGEKLMSTIWVKNSPLEGMKDKNTILYYAKHFDMDPLVMKMIFDKGIKNFFDINHFLSSDPFHLYGPFFLNDMKKAVERINIAIQKEEKMMIFGDYDTDGVTSTSLLLLALRRIGAIVDYCLPIRSEGYGLSVAAVEKN